MGENLVNLRYPYEKYEGLTEKEYLALGEDWVKAGASLEEAHFRYFPEELFRHGRYAKGNGGRSGEKLILA